MTFRPPMAWSLPGAWLRMLWMLLRQFGRGHLLRRQLAQQGFLLRVGLGIDAHRERLAQFIGQAR
jgi:hypothetical protein